MKLFVFYLLPLLLCILSNHVHCSYPITIKDNSVPLLPYLFSASTIVYKDIIYSYGGTKYTQTQGTDKLFSYTLDQSTGEMVVKLENENQGPICAYCNAVLFPNSTEMLVFSEPNYNESSIFFHNQTMWQANQTVLPHFYDLEKKTWRVAPPTKKDGQDQTFYGRVYHSTVLNGNDGVYILGGLYHYLEFPNSESESSNMTANEPLSSDSNINRNLTDYNPNPTRNGSSYNPDPYYNSSSTNITGSTSDLLKRDVEHDTKDTVGYPLITDGWYYNRHDNSYTAISLPNNEPYVDPIAYIDIDGKLALLGGCNISSTAKYIKCYDISIINIYDNATKSWGNKQAKSNPSWSYGTIAGAATQVDYNRKLLYVSGGYFTYNSLIYTNGDFSILDLERDVWIYGYPEEKSEIQIPLSKASGALIMNNTYFVKLFGLRSNENIYTEAHTIDILDLRTSASLTSQTYVDQVQPINWITSTVEDNKNSFKNKALQYIGLICILFVAVIAVALFLYFKRRNLPIYWHELKKSLLWNPRKGEPKWTEVTRLIVRFISLAILIAFLAYNINDVLTSTISTSTFPDDIQLITLPDFRLCFSGWNSSVNFKPVCHYTGNNIKLECDMELLESFYYTPHYASEMNNDPLMRCFMYAPKDPVQVSSKNASMVIETSGYTNKNQEVVYIQLYRRDENMNRIIFNNETIPGVTKNNVQSWSVNETQSDLQVTAYPNSYTRIRYQETDYEQIQEEKKWNYVGVYPDFNKYTQLSIDYSQPIIPNSIGRDGTEQYFYNLINLSPKEFKKITVTEKRDSTILDVFGSIGGVIGLIVGLQVILFGTRPTRPYGIIHYMSWRYKSISNDLEEQFRLPEAQIPFVNPVDRRFADVFKKNLGDDFDETLIESSSEIPLLGRDQLEERLSRLEARNQLLEMIMKNYYIDDEVFISLSRARKRIREGSHQVSNEVDSQEDHYDEKQFYDTVPLKSDSIVNESYPMPIPMPYHRT